MRAERSKNQLQKLQISNFAANKHRNSSLCCLSWNFVVITFVFWSIFVFSLVVFTDFDPTHPIKLPSIYDYIKLPSPAKPNATDATIVSYGRLRSPLKLRKLDEPHVVAVSPRKRYAYAITITKDGFFQDGAAVLIYSIMKYSWNASYDISFIAFVHPNVTTSRPGLRRLGFHIIEVPVPINVSAIRFDFLREKINKNGCCGSAELIKLTSYRLLQYDKVIHLDADVIFLNPIDELFEMKQSLIYTTDPNMATFKGVDKMPVQGGFIVLRPSIDDYRRIIETEMRFEFRKNHGWNSSHIGWFWGGMTVQGILPFYYNRISAPNRTLILDRCYYNTMADTEECSKQQLHELKSAHFTVCQKPWGCWKSIGNRLCKELHRRWFDLRTEAEQFFGIADPTRPACRGGGHDKYVPMLLDKVEMKRDGPRGYLLSNVRPDDSADRFDPIMPESKYISYHFD